MVLATAKVFACWICLQTTWLGVKAAAKADGPVALITGGSTGIGLATAKVLAASGYSVVITSRSEAKLRSAVGEIEATGGNAAYCQQDVTIDEEYDKCFDFAEKRFGKPVKHVFLNAGGAVDLTIPFVKQPRSALRKVIELDFIAVLIGLQKAIQVMQKNGGGSIVLCSSIVAGMNAKTFDGRFGDFVAHGVTYGTSKAALDYMARTAVYYAPENIRVYSLRPNCYSTPLLQVAADMFGAESMDAVSGFNLFFNTNAGDPKHIGHMVEHLFDGTTKWPTGSSIICDHDATYDGFIQTSELDRPVLNPGELHSVILPELRGYDGGVYECKEEYTCGFVADMKAKLAAKDEEKLAAKEL